MEVCTKNMLDWFIEGQTHIAIISFKFGLIESNRLLVIHIQALPPRMHKKPK